MGFSVERAKETNCLVFISKRILTEADLIIVNSQKERDNLRRLGLNGPIAVIPNGIILDGYDKQSAMKSEREKIILYFSRLDKKRV